MMRFRVWLLSAAAGCLLTAASGWAYVDLAPTLTRIVRESGTITVAEVVNFNSDTGAIALKKVRDLKGETGNELLKHQLIRKDEKAIDQSIIDWAEPGRRCVLFVTGKAAVVCVGEGWYQVNAADNGWWRIGATRPDLPLAFYGSVSRLVEALPLMLAGKTVVITALPHGADQEGASFDLALNRSNLPGFVKVERQRVSKNTPSMAMAVGSNPAFVLGMGRVGLDEVPALREKLQSSDPAVRAESAADLGFLGIAAENVHSDLAKLLEDETPHVRLSAASALLRVAPKKASLIELAMAVLDKGLTNSDAVTRRQAARAAGLAGAAASPLVDKLAALLKDPDIMVRRTALQAIATLGPAATGAREPVTALLDRRETAIDAAEALGRMGPAARPSLKAIARLLDAEISAERWAAVRAMSQIGGEDAVPAVKFMIKELPKATEADNYNMMIYFSLLGPVAKEALPAIRTSRRRNPFLRQTTAWAIEPSGDLPAGFGPGGPGGDGGPMGYILESYVRELGDNLKPAAPALARKILAGKAGNVPLWGYKLLARFPEESLAVFVPALSDKELVMRKRAAVALGNMGRSAAAARTQVARALETSQDEREQRLLRWCLHELE